ncbi:MAG TPA: hypothetical protein VM198_13225 [Longimicrobiales bacterium]|nr:hypothetical protein [Longimicrobiales bacterium]
MLHRHIHNDDARLVEKHDFPVLGSISKIIDEKERAKRDDQDRSISMAREFNHGVT